MRWLIVGDQVGHGHFRKRGCGGPGVAADADAGGIVVDSGAAAGGETGYPCWETPLHLRNVVVHTHLGTPQVVVGDEAGKAPGVVAIEPRTTEEYAIAYKNTLKSA